MRIQDNLKYTLIILAIFLIPFLDFLKNNIDEINIILGKSFFFLIFLLFSILLIFSFTINYIFKKKYFFNIFLSVVLIYWLLFKHNFLKLIIKSFFDKFDLILSEYNSEISLLILIALGIYASINIHKNNKFFEKFIFIFYLFSF